MRMNEIPLTLVQRNYTPPFKAKNTLIKPVSLRYVIKILSILVR
jgi:hypothetical protein